jgi:hypothetical protein
MAGDDTFETQTELPREQQRGFLMDPNSWNSASVTSDRNHNSHRRTESRGSGYKASATNITEHTSNISTVLIPTSSMGRSILPVIQSYTPPSQQV